jgi:hypothetical protein
MPLNPSATTKGRSIHFTKKVLRPLQFERKDRPSFAYPGITARCTTNAAAIVKARCEPAKPLNACFKSIRLLAFNYVIRLTNSGS